MSEHCPQCGDVISTGEWHPVVTEREDDGAVTIYDFCSEACLSTWRDDESTDPPATEPSTDAGNADRRTEARTSDQRPDCEVEP